MNKKLKIVSSLALAGMLVTSSFGMNKVLASTEDYTTNPVAVYRNLVEGKTVVPFVLVNKDDALTVKDVVENEMFKGKVEKINGTTISSLDTVVGTGDKFTTTDGTEYTIIVYGDVDGDGKVTVLDALQVEKANVNMLTLNDVQKESADVKNDGNINPLDSLAIKKYNVELTDSVIDILPEKEEVVEDSNYTLTLNNGTYINNVNYTNNKLAIELAETLDKSAQLKLVISDGANKIERNVTVEAHKDYMEITNIDLSTLKDGAIKGELYEGDKIVGTFEATKNTVVPNATNVTTNRTSTRKATLSLEKCGESDIAKVKYVVKGLEETATLEELTNSVDVQDGKLVDATIAENLETDTAYKVFYVVENQYGSQSAIKEAIIAKDNADVKAEKELEKVTAPNLGETAVAEFTWTAEASKTYIATLYKDGKAIAEKEVTSGSVDFTTDMKANGTYKVSVVVKGNNEGTTTNSKATESGEVTVSTLKAVENVQIANGENGKVILSWTNSNGKDDFKAYEISLYTIDEEGKETNKQTITPCENDKNQVDITSSITSNTIYVAKVKVVAKDNQATTLSTEEVSSNQFYKVSAPNMDTAKAGTTSVTFTVNPIKMANKDVTYKVKVYDVKTDNDQTEARYTLNTTKDVVINENNQITIDGLTSLNTYAFKLVATVDGNEVESEYSDEIRTLPIIENLTVDTVAEAGKENSGKVAVDGNNLIVNGESFDTTVITELATAKTVISTLKTGDVVTIDENATNVTLKLDGGASANVAERDLGNLKDAVVEVESNEYNKTIKGTFKTLTLKGVDSIFTVDGVTAQNPIVLTDGVEVNGNQNYKLQAGSTAIINKVKVSASQDATISATGKALTIKANESANDLVFENSSEGEAVITFTGLDNNTSEQKGTITIKSNGGKVTVESQKVNVSANIKVEVNNGEVDITEPSLTGDKTVTVSAEEGKQSTIVANATTKAPVTMNNVELKDYTDEEIKSTFGVTNQDEIIAIDQYINSFELNGKGATISVNKGEDKVTITVNGNAQNLEIGNLK